MTSRCNERDGKPRSWNVGAVALLLLLSAVGSASVRAQDEGATIPPPPKVSQPSDTSADPDFQSPMKRRQQWREQLTNGPDGERFKQQRRRQMMQNNAMSPDAGFNASGPGGPGFRGQGAGTPGMDDEGAEFQGRRRFVRHGFNEGFGMGGPGMGGPGMGGPGMGGPGMGGPGVRNFGGMRSGRGTMGGGFGHRLDLTPLNLTTDQKMRIKEIRSANRERAREYRRALMQKQAALHSLIFSPTASDADIRAARREVRKAQDAVEEVGFNDLLSIRGILTAEQKQRLPQIAPPPPCGPPGATTATNARRVQK